MVSMKDIAAACNVSVASVSKALNDHDDISKETKEMIRKVAREMGYLPNAQARALKTSRTHNIGVLYVDEEQSGLTHDYFSRVLDTFKRSIEANGYDLTFINGNRHGRKGMTLLEYCKYRGFDGVMIACVDFTDPEVIELVNSEIPIVTIDHTIDNGIAVMSDNVQGMKSLVSYVYACGHRKIGYIHGSDSGVTRRRVSSFYKTVEELGMEVKDEWVKEITYRDAAGAGRMTKEILSLKDYPTCILYADDFSCFGGMCAIREFGLNIPEDISVGGYDGMTLGRYLTPKLTTVRQDTHRMGYEAGKQMISLIERPKSTLKEPVLISTSLYEGGTVARIL